MNIQQQFLKNAAQSRRDLQDNLGAGTGSSPQLNSAGAGAGGWGAAGNLDDDGPRPQLGALGAARGPGAEDPAASPQIQLAALQQGIVGDLLDNADDDDPDHLTNGARISLYAVIYRHYRPGPAFRSGHRLPEDALKAQIRPGEQTWQAYLDALHPAQQGGIPWSQRIAEIARRCVRLDPLNAEQAGSGFLIGQSGQGQNGRILTAAHVISGPGWLFGLPPQPAHRPGQVLYNQIYHPASPPPEPGTRAVDWLRHPDAGIDAALLTQDAHWADLLSASALREEFTGSGTGSGTFHGLELQTEPLSQSDLQGRPVAVIGHPLRGNDGGALADIPTVYGDAPLGTKRFMPGFLDATLPLGHDGLLLKHDCSTLGGASGSCLLDLTTGKVLGIHVAGTVTLHNYAVPAWRLLPWLDPAPGGPRLTGATLPAAAVPTTEAPAEAGLEAAGASAAASASAAPSAATREGASTTSAAPRPVIAFTMHEYEMDLARQTLSPDGPGRSGRPQVEVSANFVMGEATPEDIATLLAAGIEVQELPTPPAPPTPPASGTPRALESPTRESTAEFSIQETTETQPFLMQLGSPLTPERAALFEKYNVQLCQALPGEQILVTLTPQHQAEVLGLPFVRTLHSVRGASQAELRALGLATPEEPPSQHLPAPLPPPPPHPHPHPDPGGAALEAVAPLPADTLFDILLAPGADEAAFLQLLQDHRISLVGQDGRKYRLALPPGTPAEFALRHFAGTQSTLEQYIPPVLHNFHAARILGLLSLQTPPAPTLPWTGAGELVAVADTGLDDAHPAFTGRIAQLVALGRPQDTSDPHGHGTHVAGSVLGSGALRTDPPGSPIPPGRPAGTAPGARLYFQSILGHPVLGNEWPLSGLPISLGSLLRPAYQAGARVHNNSWGAFAGHFYRLHSREVDEFVSQNRDLLVVISAGNEGTTRTPQPPFQRHSAPGLVDWYSLCAPATSKNALTVGASRSSITQGGYAALTHSQVWPGSLPPAQPPASLDIAGERVSGNADDLAGFSSRGPGPGLQVKPDIVAPGTDIVSARSAAAPGQHFAGPSTLGPDYAHMCGTSMSAPLVSGCAAVVREYYRVVQQRSQPSAALVKATLINGTRPLTGPHATAPAGGFPNGHQGFGCIDMASTLPLPAPAGTFTLHAYDNWLAPHEQLALGGYRDFTFQLNANTPAPATATPWLRVCLAYTDAPASGIQNVLQIQMQHQASPGDPASPKTNWFGNYGQQAGLASALPWPHANNNVSIIRPLNPQPGFYKIRVSVINLLQGPTQDFALVLTGTGISQVSGF